MPKLFMYSETKINELALEKYSDLMQSVWFRMFSPILLTYPSGICKYEFASGTFTQFNSPEVWGGSFYGANNIATFAISNDIVQSMTCDLDWTIVEEKYVPELYRREVEIEEGKAVLKTIHSRWKAVDVDDDYLPSRYRMIPTRWSRPNRFNFIDFVTFFGLAALVSKLLNWW